MTMIQLDFSREIGPVKPMHAVGQPPFGGGFLTFDFSPMQYLTDANIPYARLHDVDGSFGGNRFVDIPNLFRDFDADENDPAAYDFAFTDVLLAAMRDYRVAPVFRLGVTIENQAHIKAYRIFPPRDYGKWARICEHVIRHYNEGWANGFRYGIEYWEIWNEPDIADVPERSQMWQGTPQQYFELYDAAAKHLKACFGDTIKVGGYGAAGSYVPPTVDPLTDPYEKIMAAAPEKRRWRIRFLLDFFKYIRAHDCPLDFFSWHNYFNAEEARRYAIFLDRVMTEYGYGDVETMLNEWNNAHESAFAETSFAAAQAAAMMIAMHETKTYMLCYYDARFIGGDYGGLFNPITHKPTATYYVFSAFGELYRLGREIACEVDGHEDVYAIAAHGAGGKKAVLLTNVGEDAVLSMPEAEGLVAYLIDEEHHMTKTPFYSRRFLLKQNQTLLLKN